jgi:hypothetical protein
MDKQTRAEIDAANKQQRKIALANPKMARKLIDARAERASKKK